MVNSFDVDPFTLFLILFTISLSSGPAISLAFSLVSAYKKLDVKKKTSFISSKCFSYISSILISW
jgi:hypothetical protein